MTNEKVQCLIGIDFGTSTSLIRAKRYLSGQSIGDNHTVSSVTYGNGAGDSKAVTLVRRNGDGTYTCGRYGEEALDGSTVYRNFKMDLESPDPQKQAFAKELTRHFFQYLYERYEHQRSDIGQLTDEVQTIISYPAKWKDETREFMEAVAADVGFANVCSMDEPSAALYAVLCRKMDDIARQGFVSVGTSGYMLLIDMGAGTTDLAICRYEIQASDISAITANEIKTEIISIWPNQQSDLSFGGREIDRLLEDYLIQYLCDCGFSSQMAERAIRGIPGVKYWKEDTVSQLLSQNQRVNSCSLVSQYTMFAPQPKPFPAFGRIEFQEILGQKLEQFQKLVLDCLNHAVQQEPHFAENGVDLVVLTGGHSSWFFTSDLLDGTMPGLEHPALAKVRREKQRVLRLSNPQETVALGMVYSALPFHVETKTAPQADTQPKTPLQDFLENYRFRTIVPLMEGKQRQLAQNMNIPASVRVYMAFDAAVGCRAGTVFTDQGIYCRNLIGTLAFCCWDEFADCLLRFQGSNVYAYNEKSHVETLVGSFMILNGDIRSFYRQLWSCLKSNLHPDTQQEEMSDYLSVPFERILRQTLANYNPDILSMITGRSIPRTLQSVLRIPTNEWMYLCHDDTVLSIGTAGTVFTGRGIYSKSDGKPCSFVSWQEFTSGTLEYLGSEIWLTMPSGAKKQVGKFSSNRSQTVALYLELQKVFRSSMQEDTNRVEPPLQKHPVETFLEQYDWSFMSYLLSPALVPAISKETASFGRIFLVYRYEVWVEGTLQKNWVAVGENGIYTSNGRMLSWEEFLRGDVELIPPGGVPMNGMPRGFQPTSRFCVLSGMTLPIWQEDAVWFGIFFSELKRYLMNPADYIYPSQKKLLRKDYIPILRKTASEIQNPGLLNSFDNKLDILSFLGRPTSAEVYYYSYSGFTGALLTLASCIDDTGFYARATKIGHVYHTDFSDFISNPIWYTNSAQQLRFYAGAHLLLVTRNRPEQAQNTLGFLLLLQKRLQEGQ